MQTLLVCASHMCVMCVTQQKEITPTIETISCSTYMIVKGATCAPSSRLCHMVKENIVL